MSQKILLIDHSCKEFLISRLPLGVYLKEKGYDVYALLPANGNKEVCEKIEASGVTLLTFPHKRNDLNLLSNIKKIFYYNSIFSKYKFDIIHSFKFQPNFYSCLAGFYLFRTKIVLHITGLGIAFTKKDSIKMKLYKFISQIIFFFNFLIADKIIFQNYDDEKELWHTPAQRKKFSVITGSGVDVEKFDKSHYDIPQSRSQLGLSKDQIVLTFISRLVWHKGIKELLEASKVISEKFSNLKVLIIGNRDTTNPESIPQNVIDQYSDIPNIEFLGYKDNVAELLAISDVYVYPSYYREGVPRSVLEAMSTGIPIITTDSTGCNLCVKEDSNGYLVAPKCSTSLANAITKILHTDKLQQMGESSRVLALQSFQNKLIYQNIFEVYQTLDTPSIPEHYVVEVK